MFGPVDEILRWLWVNVHILHACSSFRHAFQLNRRRFRGAHLLQPPPLLFLLLDTLLPLGQQLALVLLLLAELLLLQELLAPQRLRALLVLLLQPDEVAPQGRLARHVHDGAALGEGRGEVLVIGWEVLWMMSAVLKSLPSRTMRKTFFLCATFTCFFVCFFTRCNTVF